MVPSLFTFGKIIGIGKYETVAECADVVRGAKLTDLDGSGSAELFTFLRRERGASEGGKCWIWVGESFGKCCCNREVTTTTCIGFRGQYNIAVEVCLLTDVLGPPQWRVSVRDIRYAGCRLSDDVELMIIYSHFSVNPRSLYVALPSLPLAPKHSLSYAPAQVMDG